MRFQAHILVLTASFALVSAAATAHAADLEALAQKLQDSSRRYEIRKAASELLAEGSGEAMATLLEALKGERVAIEQIAMAMQDAHQVQAYYPLVESLGRAAAEDWPETAAAILPAIGATRAYPAYDYLTGLLESDNVFYHQPAVRAGIYEGLGHLMDTRTLPLLQNAVTSGDESAAGAVRALAILKSKESAPSLAKALVDDSLDKDLRAACATALADLKIAEVGPLLIAVLKRDLAEGLTDDELLKIEQIKSRGRGDWYVEKQSSLLLYKLRVPVMEALAQLEEPEAVNIMGQALTAFLESGSRADRRHASTIVDYLGKMEDAQAVEILRIALTQVPDDDSALRERIQRAIDQSPSQVVRTHI